MGRGGGREMLPPTKKGGGGQKVFPCPEGGGGGDKFWTRNFPIL